MAYTKAPSVATNSTERVDFMYNSQARDATSPDKDSRLVNMMVEVLPSPNQSNTRAIIKSRPGMTTVYTPSSGIGRAIYYWVFGSVGYTITINANNVCVNGVTLSTLTTSTGPVGFVEHVNSLGQVTLFMCDGDKGYVFTNPAVAPTLITDVNFPSPHIPHPIFLDGYIFVAKSATQDVYNSELDTPTSWSEGGVGGPMYISSEMYPDNIRALSKNNNYLYAIGRTSIEYFYNAATSTGSPLQREQSAVQQFGTPAPQSVVQTEKEVILIGETGNGGYTVWAIEGFKEKEISTIAVRSILRLEGTALATARGSCIRVMGQKLYVIKLTTRTLVYSFDTQMWSEWRSGATNDSNFIGGFMADGEGGSAYILTDNGLQVGKMDEEQVTDFGTLILCEVTTPKYDFGTINRKFMHRLSLIGDTPDPEGGVNSFNISWTDDDYFTWSAPRTLTFNFDFPVITQLGAFRRRAFRISYLSTFPFRLDGMEFDINKGSQ